MCFLVFKARRIGSAKPRSEKRLLLTKVGILIRLVARPASLTRQNPGVSPFPGRGRSRRILDYYSRDMCAVWRRFAQSRDNTKRTDGSHCPECQAIPADPARSTPFAPGAKGSLRLHPPNKYVRQHWQIGGGRPNIRYRKQTEGGDPMSHGKYGARRPLATVTLETPSLAT